MVQFVLIFMHAFQLLFVNDCKFPKIFALWIGVHGVLFFSLFSNFYDKAYSDKKDRKPAQLKATRLGYKLDNLLTMCNGTQHKLLNDKNGINIKNGLNGLHKNEFKSSAFKAKKVH